MALLVNIRRTRLAEGSRQQRSQRLCQRAAMARSLVSTGFGEKQMAIPAARHPVVAPDSCGSQNRLEAARSEDSMEIRDRLE